MCHLYTLPMLLRELSQSKLENAPDFLESSYSSCRLKVLGQYKLVFQSSLTPQSELWFLLQEREQQLFQLYELVERLCFERAVELEGCLRYQLQRMQRQ